MVELFVLPVTRVVMLASIAPMITGVALQETYVECLIVRLLSWAQQPKCVCESKLAEQIQSNLVRSGIPVASLCNSSFLFAVQF